MLGILPPSGPGIVREQDIKLPSQTVSKMVADWGVRRRRFTRRNRGQVQSFEHLRPSIVITRAGFAKNFFQVAKDPVISSYQLDFDFAKATDRPPVLKNTDVVEDDVCGVAFAVLNPDDLSLCPESRDLLERYVSEVGDQQLLYRCRWRSWRTSQFELSTCAGYRQFELP
jgi:hypothetical protein